MQAKSSLLHAALSVLLLTMFPAHDASAEVHSWAHLAVVPFGALTDPVIDHAESLSSEFFTSAPEAEVEPLHGPAAEEDKTSTAVRLSCNLEIADVNHNVWTWTYIARLYDPNNQQIGVKQAYHTSSSWTPSLIVEIDENDEGTYTCKVDWWADSYYLGLYQAAKEVVAACPGDEERSKVRQEYVDHEVNWTPECSDFQTTGSSANFAWYDLNGAQGNPHRDDLGIVKSVLWDGLEDTLTEYDRGDIHVESGYRCPHGTKRSAAPARVATCGAMLLICGRKITPGTKTSGRCSKMPQSTQVRTSSNLTLRTQATCTRIGGTRDDPSRLHVHRSSTDCCPGTRTGTTPRHTCRSTPNGRARGTARGHRRNSSNSAS